MSWIGWVAIGIIVLDAVFVGMLMIISAIGDWRLRKNHE